MAGIAGRGKFLAAVHAGGMPNYRRIHVPGSSYFYTVNLFERRRTLPVDCIELLRNPFFVARESFIPLQVRAAMLDHSCMAPGACRLATTPSSNAGATQNPHFVRSVPVRECVRDRPHSSFHRYVQK